MLVVHSINGGTLTLTDQEVSDLVNSVNLAQIILAKEAISDIDREQAIGVASLFTKIKGIAHEASSNLPGNPTGLPSC